MSGTTSSTFGRVPGHSLSRLREVRLNGKDARALEDACAMIGGSAAWKARKRAEVQSLMRLSTIAPPGRFRLLSSDLREQLRLVVAMDVMVPCISDTGDCFTHKGAILGLTYIEEAMRLPSPGHSMVTILSPERVWHANVAHAAPPFQALCLGANLPAGVPLVEIVIAAYGALSMQSVMIDERDSAGVLNVPAARWWQQNAHRIPLSPTPFLVQDDAASAGGAKS